MTVTNVVRDTDALTLTITAEFDAAVERTWQLWADPRQLERWWGPPTYPATMTDHDLRAGGHVSYFMTSPEGDKYHGYWDVVAVDAPARIELLDAFADETGAKNESMPVTSVVVTFAAHRAGGTVMTIQSSFPTRDAMDQLIQMGMDEGMVAALGQTDEILAESVSTG